MSRAIRLIPMLLLACCLMHAADLPAASGNNKDAGSKGSPQDFSQMSLEQLLQVEVTGASKFPQTAAEAPASVTVITSDEIERYGYRNLAEILRATRSFYFTYDRNYMYLGVRGFARPGDYNTRVLTLVNGHRINVGGFDATWVDQAFPVDVDMIDRVEIIRGPSSSLYGTNAFFAVINVVTRRGKELNGVEVAGESWSYDTLKGSVAGGYAFANGLDLALAGSLFDSSGQDLYFPEFDSPETNNGMAVGGDYEKYGKALAQVSFKDFRFQGAFSSRKKGVPTGSYGITFNDVRNHTIDAMGFLGMEYNRELSEQTRITGSAYFDRFYYYGSYIYDLSPEEGPGTVLNEDTEASNRLGGEIKVDRRMFKTHLLTVGGEFKNDYGIVQRNYDQGGETYLDDHRSLWSSGLYVQDEFKFHPKATVSLGLRYDNYETFGGTTNPRAAFIYNPGGKVTFKFLYGQAFRAPNAYELYYEDGYAQAQNPDLKPEKIRTTEVVFEKQFGGNLQIAGSAFYNRIRDLISLQAQPETELLVFQNTEQVEAKGLELELSGKWASGLMGRVSYSYQRAKDCQTGLELTNSPRHLAKFNLSAPFVKNKVFGAIETHFMSGRQTLGGTVAPAYWLTNVVFTSRRLLRGFALSFGVYNVFDQRIGDPGFDEHPMDIIWQDGRTFRLRLFYEFDFRQ